LGVDDDGVCQRVQVVVADEAVVAQGFDAQEASVGGKPIPQRGQIAQSPTDLEVVVLLMVAGAECLTFFYCLTRDFVVDVKRGRRLRLEPCPERPRRLSETRRAKISCI
jgi:hypothetical protein